MDKIRVIQIGMGPLGLKIANFISHRSGIETVAAVDKNNELIGKKLSDMDSNLPAILIKSTLKEALESSSADVAIITTVSDMERITPQILEAIELGLPVVSTCEELSYPWLTAKKLAEKIDASAKEKGIAVVGTGVNPGFLMDSLPTFLTSVCQSVEKVSINRFQNAAFRRIPFQKKIGAGATLDEFEKRKAEGSLRHVGLTESIYFIASHLEWTLDKTEDIISPVIAEEDIDTNNVQISKGLARGVRQVGTGYINGEPKIKLVFQATVGEKESYDEIEIQGTPTIKSKIEGGVNGDIATCAITVNCTKSILKAVPGLRTMGDLPIPSFFKG